MQGNKRANTKPELLLRTLLRAHGLTGYRLQWKVPGHPDVCWPGKKVAVFVNGCFWHRCPYCKLTVPKTNVEYWTAKFERNRARDARNVEALVNDGWTVLVVWECALKKGRLQTTMAQVVRQIELSALGILPHGRVVEVGYMPAWRHRVAWRRRH